MIVTLDDCECALERLSVGAPMESGRHATDELQMIRVSEGNGQFQLTAPLSGARPADLAVDLVPGALNLRSGVVSRWVPLPLDALPDQAVVETSASSVTVVMPLRERRPSRHLVYVW